MLWSSIHIPVLDLRAPLLLRRRLEGIVQAWLERSATCPLSVSFFDDNHYDESAPNPENHPVILQLLSISRRLRHLTLVGDTELLRLFLRLGPESLPLLKRVWIQPPTGSNLLFEDDEDHPPSTNALQLATLEDVTLQMSSATDPLTLPLRWSQLTQLRLESFPVWSHQGQEGGLDVDGALDVLRRCPNLVQCEIRVTTPSEYPLTTLDTSSIILPHMHTLVLSGYRLRFQKWIAHLVAPKLRFLRVGDEMDWEHTASSAARDGYMSADIDTTHFTSSGLHELLQSFPMISHLRLASSMGTLVQPDDAFLALLSLSNNLCPPLANVTILTPSAVFSDAAALAFVQARMAMPTPLQQFQVLFSRPMELDIMPELQFFISGSGLQVDIEYPQRPRWSKFRPRYGLDVPQSQY